ncbi:MULTISPECIES: hypothetical protein [unclassified Amycolatopsis]|uniref:hypothetical protein n=1 Tax=unclassified Amycolatopsis TaxID=2618356 RepID=UPI0021082302|nr:hypothetical protein [Amycolatopsis sp. DSM 110486]
MGNDANTMGKELKGMAIGAGYGAAIGSVVPGVGTAVGAGVGAIAGGLVGLFSGGPEAQQQSADLGGRSIDAYSIYQKIHAGDPASLENGSKAAGELKTVHSDRVTEIDNLNKKMDTAWQGGGATAAQAGAHPLGIWLQDSAGNLGKSDMYLGNQVDCFHTVKSKVQDLPKDPPSAGFLDGINPLSDKDDEINQYNDNSKANVQAYTAYFNASNSNAQQLPQYSAWQGNNLSDGGGGNNFGGGGGGGNFGGGGGVGGGGGGSFNPANMPKFDAKPTDFTTGHSGINDPNNPNNTGIPTGTYTPPGSDSTTAQGFTPSSFDSSGFGPGGAGGFGPGGGAGGFGPGGSGGGFGGGGAGSGAVAGFGPGAFGGGFGAGGAASGAAAGLGAGEGAAGAGMRGGAMSGAAGKAGTSGMGGMGAGGAKGGKGTEDEEHQTKYLVEEDANELFGTDELTAPPVIGE